MAAPAGPVLDIQAGLARLDRRLTASMHRLRATAASCELPATLCITDQEAERLLAARATPPATDPAEDFVAARDHGIDPSLNMAGDLGLARLRRHFGLGGVEIDAILLALAPEIDPSYRRIYAYLHDDITLTRPSIALLADLHGRTDAGRLSVRSHFLPGAPLRRHRLIQLGGAEGEPLPCRSIVLPARVANWLLGETGGDPALCGLVHVLPAPADADAGPLAGLAGSADILVHLQGPDGIGRRRAAAALCRHAGRSVLAIDTAAVVTRGGDPDDVVAEILREAALCGHVPYWNAADTVLADRPSLWRHAILARSLAFGSRVFLAGHEPWRPDGHLRGIAFASVTFPPTTTQGRRAVWDRALGTHCLAPGELDQLSSAFRFTPGQIMDAAAALAAGTPPTLAAVQAACRQQCRHRLGELAQRIEPRRGWGDIVLPEERMVQLRELTDTARHRATVQELWGFAERMPLGRGTCALFAGPSGTGKTLAAEVIAGVLGLDLYKIDLSAVVSKFIGETEKNLSRIFAEAESSNAVLFFDEADSLFGKRTEVKDAHDRYANIETAYLLQRIEAYEGLVVLATNLRKNMDEAFVRRLQVCVEFPPPGEAERRRIWEGILPPQTPQAADLDFDLLAARFDLSGGHIRNVALAAAYSAASAGRPIGMAHLLHATKREYQKIGKVMAGSGLGQLRPAV